MRKDQNRNKESGRRPAPAPVRKKKEKTSRCPFSSNCGGCTDIDTPMEEQLEEKQKTVESCIGMYGPVERIIAMKNPGRYRHKVTSIFGLDYKGHPVCGVYRARSHEIVPVTTCMIENRIADSIVQSIFRLLPSFKLKVYDEVTGKGQIRAVQVRVAEHTGQVMVTIVTNGPAFPSKEHFVETLLREQERITTIVQNINSKSTTMVLGTAQKVLYGPGYIEDELCGKRFRISSRSFYQINPLQTEKLYNVAIDMAGLSGKERVLDAYCGIGTIGICAAGKAKEVLGVELNDEAIEDAKVNAGLNGITNISFESDDAGRFAEDLAARGEKIDVLFMDPPRSGASEEFLKSILTLAPKKIVYISCNPETLGENLKVLTDGGYEMKKAVPVDMFPFTRNIEVSTELTRK